MNVHDKTTMAEIGTWLAQEEAEIMTRFYDGKWTVVIRGARLTPRFSEVLGDSLESLTNALHSAVLRWERSKS
jgi:hypothetical protein